MTRYFLWLISLISLIISIIWFINEKTLEALLAILTCVASFIGSFLIDNNIYLKNIKAGRDIYTKLEGAGQIKIDGATAENDFKTVKKNERKK